MHARRADYAGSSLTAQSQGVKSSPCLQIMQGIQNRAGYHVAT